MKIVVFGSFFQPFKGLSLPSYKIILAETVGFPMPSGLTLHILCKRRRETYKRPLHLVAVNWLKVRITSRRVLTPPPDSGGIFQN